MRLTQKTTLATVVDANAAADAAAVAVAAAANCI